MSEHLLNAYRQAKYVLHCSGNDRVMRVGQHYDWLDRLLESNKVEIAAFITPFNPASNILPINENESRLRKLRQELIVSGYQFIEGFGQDDEGKWPAETSLLIFGLTQSEASKLASDYGQNAFLYISKNNVIRLDSLMSPFASS